MPHSTASHLYASIPDLSFEEALAELEQIVRGLESGKMTLEDALKSYERGAQLRKHCEARLGEAEMRVRAIVQNADGTVEITSPDQINAPVLPVAKKRAGRMQEGTAE